MGNMSCKRIFITRKDYKRNILIGRMKDFEDNIEGTNEPFVYFKDYEEMNDKFIKEYKKNFSTGKEYQFDLIEN